MSAERTAIALIDDIVPTEHILNHYCPSNMDMCLLKTAEIIGLSWIQSNMLLCAYELHNPSGCLAALYIDITYMVI